MDDRYKIAKTLLEINAIKLTSLKKPFVWASGIKSPIYCDNRLIMSYPDFRDFVAKSFVKIITEKFPQVEIIAGTATAGIPHAAWISQKMNLPMIYIRSSQKEHGKRNVIEGKLEENQNVVLIEDLISTGGSSIKREKQYLTASGSRHLGDFGSC